METQVTGTLIDGVVRLDQSVDIPNNTRVKVTMCELAIVPPGFASDPSKRKAALVRFLQRAADRRFNSKGIRFSRDELHDRH